MEPNSSSKNNRIAANVFFVLMLFPFASPYPIATDVQPLAGIAAFLFLLYSWLKKKKIGRGELIGSVLCIFFIIYFNPFETINFNEGKIFALLLGFFTYVFIQRNLRLFSAFVFKQVVYLYFLLSIFFILSPGIFIGLQSFFIRKSNVTELGYRGISTLSTEPGLFGGLLVGLLAINYYFYKVKLLDNKEFYLGALMILFMIIMTKSGTGYLYLIVFSMVALLKGHNIWSFLSKGLLITIALVFLTFLSTSDLNFDKYGRGLHVFSKVVTNPALVIKDRSIVYRVYAVYVATLSLVDSPFGVGHASVAAVSQNIVDNDNELNHFYRSYGEKFHPVSSFGFYLTAYGLLFLVPFVYVFYKSKASLENKVMALIFFLFSFSLAFPIAWLLLSMKINKSLNLKIATK